MTSEELQGRHLTELAAQCRKVADNVSLDSGSREKALALALEWNRLPKPRNLVLAKKKALDAQHEDLKKRIVDFLAVL